ncbi:MAG TPA: GNAT family N-acetyltransferase [Thermoanaerobaculales bacterium]|nr:GNAT family N-acetyltransferase [Thermoanaerobaculales bacterium]HQN96590.1 GNAT family N-acetyltransferase [Thermoanaerobaculales bacterium]HQP43730.1 GNAT family N-acetyltransferase [Thermoanaerobaculales bacterium]
MAKVKARRTNREELPGIAVLRDSLAPKVAAYQSRPSILDLDMDLDPTLEHLMNHDPDGFFTAIDGDETVGFCAAIVRSRQCVLSELWVLPQHQGKGAGELLLTRALAYGERSGARSYLALVPAEPAIQGLLLRHSFQPLTPVYQFAVASAAAATLARGLGALLEGRDAAADLLARRGQADIDRIDRVTRDLSREVDHTYWLKRRALGVALVRQGSRIAAYGYGGRDQVGPAAGSSREAAMCALGWALRLAAGQGAAEPLVVRVPARFDGAVEALLEAGARIQATLLLYGINVNAAFDRCLLAALNLP